MIPIARVRELLCHFFTKDLHMFVVMSWDDLVPSANGLVGGLFGKLLCDCSLGGVNEINFHNVEIQLLSSFKEGLVLDRSSHSCNPYEVHWFPRCHSFGANDNRSRECACCPIGVSICCHKPWITKDKVIQSHVSNVETEKMRSFSGDDFEFGEIFQTPSCIGGSVGILEFPRVLHKVHPQSMFIDELLTDETLSHSTIEECDVTPKH